MKILPLLFIFIFSLSVVGQQPAIQTKIEPSVLYEQSVKAVVYIMVANKAGDFSSGSGVILRSDGVIATNYHVIEGATSAKVKLQNGDIYDDVSVLDTDERKDIAILKIKATNLPFLTTADSDLLKIGSSIYAIGSPKGLQGSISSGIISSIRPANEVSSDLSGFRIIQFTAPISPGSSGGPVINEFGSVIGLAAASRTDGQSLNIAIPINYISPLVLSAKNEGLQLAKLPNPETRQPPPPPVALTGTVQDIVGTYIGGWASGKWDVSGELILNVKIENGVPTVQADFTGSEYFSRDILDVKVTSLGTGIWRMDYKGRKSKIKGTGIFKDGKFVGDYKVGKLLWVDTGKWVLTKS